MLDHFGSRGAVHGAAAPGNTPGSIAREPPSTGEPGCGGAVAFGAMVRALPPG